MEENGSDRYHVNHTPPACLFYTNRFKNLAMKVVVDKAPVKDSEVAGFIDELKKIPCLHFKAIPAEANEPPETLSADTDKD